MEYDSDWYLILEDDAALSKTITDPTQFPRHISDCMRCMPADWDILYLGHASSSHGRGPKVVSTKGIAPMFKARYLWQLHGYIVRGCAAHKLLSHLPVNGPVDNFVASLTYDDTLVAYALQTPLLVQPGTVKERQADSDVHHSGRDVTVKDSSVVNASRASDSVRKWAKKSKGAADRITSAENNDRGSRRSVRSRTG